MLVMYITDCIKLHLHLSSWTTFDANQSSFSSGSTFSGDLYTNTT